MNLFFLALLAVPFGCLAPLSLLAILGVVALAGALYILGTIKAGLGAAAQVSRGFKPAGGNGPRYPSARLH